MRRLLPVYQWSISAVSYCADLVTMAERLNPIPSRTRPLNAPAPMVLHLKVWESRSLPGLRNMRRVLLFCSDISSLQSSPARENLACQGRPSSWRGVEQPARRRSRPKKLLPGMVNAHILGAGWSSPVARQAHNLKVVGSNPTPATKKTSEICQKTPHLVNAEWGVFLHFLAHLHSHLLKHLFLC